MGLIRGAYSGGLIRGLTVNAQVKRCRSSWHSSLRKDNGQLQDNMLCYVIEPGTHLHEGKGVLPPK